MRTRFPVIKENKQMSEVELIRNASEMLMRSQYAALLGQSYGGARDLYNICGHNKQLIFQDFWNMFRRGPLGKRVVNAPVESTWRNGFRILEDGQPKDTEFEKAYKAMDEKFKLTSRFARLDKLVGLGEYAILLMGFNDGAPLDQPISGTSKNRQLTYLQTYHWGAASISEWDADPNSLRFGQPKLYQISLGNTTRSSAAPSQSLTVHYSRVLHVAEELIDNEVTGIPRLEASINILQNIEKIVSGSAEMFWQGALGGKAFSAKEGFNLTSASLSQMQEELDDFYNGLRRNLRLQGVDIQDIAPSLHDPKGWLEVQVDILSGITRIPKRLLLGSERGELASSQDESNWLSVIADRRCQYAEPQIIFPFIDYMIQLGVLPPTKEVEEGRGYTIKWSDLWSPSEQEQATTAKTKTEALAAYVNAPGAEEILPVDFYLEEFLKLKPDQIDRIKKLLSENPPMTPQEKEEEQAEVNEILSRGQDPQEGGATGKKPGAKNPQQTSNEEEVIENFNPNHDPNTGEFATGPGGAAQQAADNKAKATAKERGYRVPPAWHHVEVAKDPSADLQVTGIDSKGRKQYIYTAEASQRGAAQKFARLKQFTRDYPKMMENVESDMKSGAKAEEARALYLISKTGFRIGGDRDTGAEQQAFGASTLLGSHVSVKGNKVMFNFVGKKGVQQNHTLEDANVAKWCKGKGPNDRLFNTTPDKVRDYLHEVSGKDYKVKDFRTHVATATAIQTMKGMPKPTTKTQLTKAVNNVAKVVAEKLGNTPAMAKNAYINPAVWGAWGV